MIKKMTFHGCLFFTGKAFAGFRRESSLKGKGWMSNLVPLEMSIFLSRGEYLRTSSVTSESKKSAGFRRISSATFFVLPLAANNERHERKMARRTKTLTIQTLKRGEDKKTSQKIPNGKRRKR
jgi:hypothetical protein